MLKEESSIMSVSTGNIPAISSKGRLSVSNDPQAQQKQPLTTISWPNLN
jgi:hypothetical protein